MLDWENAWPASIIVFVELRRENFDKFVLDLVAIQSA